MKRAFCVVFFSVLISSTTQAGYQGQITLASGSQPNGSLGNALDGLGSVIVGTNLSAPTMTILTGSSSGTSATLNGYFDFNTGAYEHTNTNGDQVYASGGNFFILSGLLEVAAGLPPLASSLTTGEATVHALGISTPKGDAEYQLTMSFSGAYLSQEVASFYGLPYVSIADGGRLYSGVLSFIYVNDSSLAGNQLLSGSILFNAPISNQAVPEPSSLAMVLIGGATTVLYGRRRLARRNAA